MMSEMAFPEDCQRLVKKAVVSNKRSRFAQATNPRTQVSTESSEVGEDTSTVALSLLKRVASGDGDAMNECLQTYGGLVWKIVSVRCRNRADAEDVVQEIFLDLWKSSSRFDPEVASEATFIAMLARRRVIDQQRKSQRTLATQPLADSVEGGGTLSQVDVSDEAAKARSMMSQLREEERSVIELAVDEGLSQSQISDRTNLPLGTVKTHARRGLQRLRKLLLGDSRLLEGGAQ